MGYLGDFISLGVIALLGAISPGPDFIVLTQSSLQHGKKAGIWTALGISIGCLVHISYCILGIGVIVAESVLLFSILKYLGAAYLIYLGIKALFSSSSTLATRSIAQNHTPLSAFSAFKKGLLVNLLNPKVTLFILSIFTQVIDPNTPRPIQALMGLEFGAICFAWFSILATLLTHPLLRQKLYAIQHIIEKILGGFLILLGLKVATYH